MQKDALVLGLLLVALLLAMLAAFVVGRRYGMRFRLRDPKASEVGIQTVDAAVYALLGLLLAFTFTGAADRFDERRKLIIDEANMIGTAYRRIDLLPAASQPSLRADFRRYLDSRLAVYQALPDIDEARRRVRESHEVEDTLWKDAMAALKQANDAPTTILFVGALNPMIDIAATRIGMTEIHPPPVVFLMLAAFAIASTYLLGFEMAKEKGFSRVHVFGVVALTALTISVIGNYEYPRLGWIRIHSMDHILADVRNEMK
jgi:hypothetical protein